MYAIAITLAILGTTLVVLLYLEIRNFRTGRTLITRRRLMLRVLAGMLLMSLIAAVFVGLFLLKLESAQGREALFLIYWCSCLGVAIALVWVMLADLQEVEDRFSQRQHEIWRDLAQFAADQVKTKQGEDAESKGKSEP